MKPTLVRALAVADAGSVAAAPGAVLLENGRLLAAGHPASIGQPAAARIVDRPRSVLLPALVNAHAHLDLTHIGPIPYAGQFTGWVEEVRRRRGTTAAAIAASVERGVVLARAGGTAFVGDIAGSRSLVPVQALRAAGLPGVSYVEVFGLGRGAPAAVDALRTAVETCPAEERGVRLGLQPHAPYSCDIEVFRAAAAMGRPLATHLAETLEEVRFLRTADGPLADMIRRLGAWDATIRPAGVHPIDYLAEVLSATPFTAAHLNYLEDRHLELLARWPLSVVYCPRASAYFGHPHEGHGPHRYRDMMDLGVNVALGTDSILCLDTPDRLSVLDEMRFLYRRDGGDPRRLLAMATVAGAAALGIDRGLVTLEGGRCAGIIAVEVEDTGCEPLRGALLSRSAPEWILPEAP